MLRMAIREKALNALGRMATTLFFFVLYDEKIEMYIKNKFCMLIFQRSDQYFKNEINKTLSLCFLFSRRDSKREIIAGQKKKVTTKTEFIHL